MLKVVADTNVVVSALLKPHSNPALIISLIIKKQLKLCLSAYILKADNKFLECSFTAKADFLITGNTRHFSFKTFHHTGIVTPAEFLYVIAKLLLKD